MASFWISVFVLLSALCGIEGSFNLYIGVDEVKRLLGLSNELYYVREGVPNVYALQFTVPVPPQVDGLHFTWQTLGQKALPYTMSMEFSDSEAMVKPSLNISSKGNIPTETQTFQVFFPCTGTTSDEVNFELRINVTSMTHLRTLNVTTIVLKRRRICLRDPQKIKKERGHAVVVSGGHPTSVNSKDKKISKESDFKKAGKVEPISENSNLETLDTDEIAGESNWIFVLVGAISGLVFILIVLTVAAFAFTRTKKDGHNAESNGFLHVDSSGNGSSGSASGGSLFTRPDSPAHHYSSLSTRQSSDCIFSGYYANTEPPFYSEVSTNNTYKPSSCHGNQDTRCHGNKLAEMMTIPRCKVRLQSVILEGSFAKIYNGTVLEQDGAEKNVIVKTVNDQTSPVQMALLLQEGLSFVGLRQQHISAVIAVAAEERAPPFLIYADEGFRNLKRFLQRCRSGPGRPISAQEVVHMAIQIGSGLAFLHRQNVVHRDVAARNCIVDDQLNVKVSDSALVRDLFPDDYHSLSGFENRPIKWSPPEVILANRSSAPGDMWSFGVLLWELFTLAQQPYAEIQVTEVLTFLRKGYRLGQPLNCPDELYSAMTGCWTWEDDDRPKWSHVLPELQDLYAQLARYV